MAPVDQPRRHAASAERAMARPPAPGVPAMGTPRRGLALGDGHAALAGRRRALAEQAHARARGTAGRGDLADRRRHARGERRDRAAAQGTARPSEGSARPGALPPAPLRRAAELAHRLDRGAVPGPFLAGAARNRSDPGHVRRGMKVALVAGSLAFALTIAGCGGSPRPRVQPDLAGKPTWGGCSEFSEQALSIAEGARGAKTLEDAIADYREAGDRIVEGLPRGGLEHRWLVSEDGT